MIKKVIEISQKAMHLSVRRKQLALDDGNTISYIPLEDIGMVVVDHPRVTYSHAALTSLGSVGAVLVVCGKNHHPQSMTLPFSSNTELVQRLREQIGASQPLKKRLWRQIVHAKVLGQAANLPEENSGRKRLIQLAKEIKSGDSSNVEGQAAKIYWRNLLPDIAFKRETRSRKGLNAILNYGYAIIRAATARAIVAAGLHPAIGIHHRNRSNAFCLADDLMEPLRPMVDLVGRDLFVAGYDEVNIDVKKRLLELLFDRMESGGNSRPLMLALHSMVASLVECYQRRRKKLEIPIRIISSADRILGSE